MMNEHKKWLQMLVQKQPEDSIDYFILGKKVGDDPTAPRPRLLPTLYPGGEGILGCYTRFKGASRGHFEVTYNALKEAALGFSCGAMKSIARASRLPDVMYFTDLKYHAMSIHDTNGCPVDKQKSFSECVDKFRSLRSTFRQALEEERIADFFFFLGQAFHLIQDVAVHQGMTNPEHAYLDEEQMSPDINDNFLDLAARVSEHLCSKDLQDTVGKMMEVINACADVSWSEYEGVRDIVSVGVSGLEYKLDALSERKTQHVSRWFTWNGRKPYSAPLGKIVSMFFQ